MPPKPNRNSGSAASLPRPRSRSIKNQKSKIKNLEKYFYLSQRNWIEDDSPLKLVVKSRQTGFSFCNCYRLVLLVSADDARLDAYISSRDQTQAKLQLEDCVHWAEFLHLGATDHGEMLFDPDTGSSAYVLEFANGRRIYSLSSNPNALAGKRGHVTLDEFALHADQRLLYRVAKPVTTWGGQLSIISTPRGATNLFAQIVRAIKQSGNAGLQPAVSHVSNLPTSPGNAGLQPAVSQVLNLPTAQTTAPPLDPPLGEIQNQNSDNSGSTIDQDLEPNQKSKIQIQKSPDPSLGEIKIQKSKIKNDFGSQWSFHEVPLQKAVDEGIVERINKKTGRNESREDFLNRFRAECIDEDQWLQEYCCVFTDEAAAFFSHDLLDPCTDPTLHLLSLDQVIDFYSSSSSIPASNSSGQSKIKIQNSKLFLGLDVARTTDLCVIDVGEKIDNVMFDRLRIELLNTPFSELERQLYQLLALPQLKRACIDHTGNGMQLAERARQRFGWKVEPVDFTNALKEELAFNLRHDFEDRRLRIPADDKLRADLRSLKKEVTPTGKLRFIGDTDDSHCDRTWAKALRQHAARPRPSAGAIVV